MEELQKSHVLKVEELSRRKLTEDQNTNLELRAKIQELQTEAYCMNAQEILRMPSQYAVDHPTFPVDQRYFHLS